MQLILAKYQPVSSYTDPVPSSTTYNSSSRKAQSSRLNNFSGLVLIVFRWFLWSTLPQSTSTQLRSFSIKIVLPSDLLPLIDSFQVYLMNAGVLVIALLLTLSIYRFLTAGASLRFVLSFHLSSFGCDLVSLVAYQILRFYILLWTICHAVGGAEHYK